MFQGYSSVAIVLPFQEKHRQLNNSLRAVGYKLTSAGAYMQQKGLNQCSSHIDSLQLMTHGANSYQMHAGAFSITHHKAEGWTAFLNHSPSIPGLTANVLTHTHVRKHTFIYTRVGSLSSLDPMMMGSLWYLTTGCWCFYQCPLSTNIRKYFFYVNEVLHSNFSLLNRILNRESQSNGFKLFPVPPLINPAKMWFFC